MGRRLGNDQGWPAALSLPAWSGPQPMSLFQCQETESSKQALAVGLQKRVMMGAGHQAHVLLRLQGNLSLHAKLPTWSWPEVSELEPASPWRRSMASAGRAPDPAEQQGFKCQPWTQWSRSFSVREAPRVSGLAQASSQAPELMRAPTSQAQSALPAVGVHPAWSPVRGCSSLLSPGMSQRREPACGHSWLEAEASQARPWRSVGALGPH